MIRKHGKIDYRRIIKEKSPTTEAGRKEVNQNNSKKRRQDDGSRNSWVPECPAKYPALRSLDRKTDVSEQTAPYVASQLAAREEIVGADHVHIQSSANSLKNGTSKPVTLGNI